MSSGWSFDVHNVNSVGSSSVHLELSGEDEDKPPAREVTSSRNEGYGKDNFYCFDRQFPDRAVS